MPSSLDNLEEAIRKLQDLYDDPDIVIPASQLPEKPNPYKAFEERNPMAGGGMLVQPSADGRRPGYAVSKRGDNYRVTGERGGKTYAQWAKENNLPQTFSNKKEANAAEKKFYKSVATKFDETAKNWSNEMTTLTEKFNKIVERDFQKVDICRAPADRKSVV